MTEACSGLFGNRNVSVVKTGRGGPNFFSSLLTKPVGTCGSGPQKHILRRVCILREPIHKRSELMPVLDEVGRCTVEGFGFDGHALHCPVTR